MQLGEVMAPALMAGPPGAWRFVTADTASVHRRVNEIDRNARLVASPYSGEVAVAVFVEPRHIGPDADELVPGAGDRGGAWLLAFFPRRDGERMVGEPDASILSQMRERDAWRTHRRDANYWLNRFEHAQELADQAFQERSQERLEGETEERLYAWARARRTPWRPNSIFVP